MYATCTVHVSIAIKQTCTAKTRRIFPPIILPVHIISPVIKMTCCDESFCFMTIYSIFLVPLKFNTVYTCTCTCNGFMAATVHVMYMFMFLITG